MQPLEERREERKREEGLGNGRRRKAGRGKENHAITVPSFSVLVCEGMVLAKAKLIAYLVPDHVRRRT